MSTSPFRRAPRLALLAAGALALAASPAGAQAPAAKTPVIAVIDMAKVSSESLLGKSYAGLIEKLRDEIESERTKKQNELNKIDASIKALQDEIEKQAQVLSPDALEKKRQELTKKGRDRAAYLEDGQQEIQRLQERAQAQAQAYNAEFQEKIRPVIEGVVKDKGIDILFDSQVTLTINKAFDISGDVVVKSDDVEKAKGSTAAPKAN
jgi:Skp family chaperone for outer membrane proteins